MTTGRLPPWRSSTSSPASVRGDGDALAIAVAVGAALIVIGAVYLSGSPEGPPPAAQAPQLTVGQVFRDCPTCPLMRVLPAGTVLQGSMSTPPNSLLHKVAIAAPIAFAPRETTIGEFEEFADETRLRPRVATSTTANGAGATTSTGKPSTTARTTMHPVGCVAWDDAVAYAAWLSKKTGQSYRLPSASEWEYAASAGVSPATPLVDDIGCCVQASERRRSRAAAAQYPGWNVLDCNDHYVQSAPVGSFAPNAFGLHDMIGNMFEWVRGLLERFVPGRAHRRLGAARRRLRIPRDARRLVVHRARLSARQLPQSVRA